jgi:queuine tRNA-ribosyltransferase
MYTLKKKSEKSKARRGVVETAHGNMESPFFMTIATKAAVKTLSREDIDLVNPQILLSNTYHLMLRPGMEIMQQAGGLHKFMNWDGPILTDSGGYQVFSLAKMRKITEEGVTFNSHISGQKYLLTPERAVEIQQTIGSDIMMCLDECPPYPSTYEYTKTSMELTLRWAQRCKDFFDNNDSYKSNDKQHIFAIIQGGNYDDLRKECAQRMAEMDFDGYAVGGLAVGEPREKMYEILSYITDYMPADKPRYLMGVGYPQEIVTAVSNGIDMFDCVIPTREGRHGRMFAFTDKENLDTEGDFYTFVNIRRAEYATDFSPINADSEVPQLRYYTKAYLHHLFKTNETLGQKLASMNNIDFYMTLMKRIRTEIEEGTL